MREKFISLPLGLGSHGVARTDDYRESVRGMLNLIVSTSCGSSEAFPDLGFFMQNYRFHNFGAGKLLVDSGHSQYLETCYEWFITDDGNNENTFGSDLRRRIEKYETRLKDVKVKVEYARENETITITITGNLCKLNGNPSFEHAIDIHVW